MNTIRWLALLAAPLLILSCFDDDPVKTKKDDPDPVSPYSGTFAIVDSVDYNTCSSPPVTLTTVNVTIEGDTIYFGGFLGGWDEGTLTGAGTSPEVTVPVSPPTCYGHYTFSFEIVYSDTDHFSGWYHLAYRKDAGCPNPDPCEYLYRIRGSR
ncbi:MAG: hypothetical protein PHQ19_00535 [Candidatus Krumholzibacteria bacterium]|nr:hypothetical protein [Candidatus Krumholzibacteria bacterium]